MAMEEKTNLDVLAQRRGRRSHDCEICHNHHMWAGWKFKDTLLLLSMVTLVIHTIWGMATDKRFHRDVKWLLGLEASDNPQPYGNFPRPDDPFHFIPCTPSTLPPSLDDDDDDASGTWARLFDPDPDHWIWGPLSDHSHRGIFLCGYLDVPLDHLNPSDNRLARLVVNRYQPSGPNHPSDRTIVLGPGGPGVSGTRMAYTGASSITARFSNSTLDVLSFDPRGVNASSPSISCFPHDATRDRWLLLTGQYREVVSPRAQLELADAFHDAVFRACRERHGDVPRFMSTAYIARDLEEIRKAMGEEALSGYMVSYGTGIAQTYANMFPDKTGRMILDGTQYDRDHRLLAGFGWTALDNATDAWRDGFLGECVAAGPERCALAEGRDVTVHELEGRMEKLLSRLIERPVPGYAPSSGPGLVTYSSIVGAIYGAMYDPFSWPALAQMLADLEGGNSTLAASLLDRRLWEYTPGSAPSSRPSSDELALMVICSDSFYAGLPGSGLDWWESLWANMTRQSWIAGNSRFLDVFPCQRFAQYWPEGPAEVYEGDLTGRGLKSPLLLVAVTYDPANPLRNGRRLREEMGRNARLVVHHGYGHMSVDRSSCTDEIARRYILQGMLPEEAETGCSADEKPYRYTVDEGA